MRWILTVVISVAACCPDDTGQRTVELDLDPALLSPMQRVLLDYCRDDTLDCEYLCRDMLRTYEPGLAPRDPLYECELINDEGVEKLRAVYYDGSVC